MKYYLSSFKLGNEIDKLEKLLQTTPKKFGYVPNALDSMREKPWWQEHVDSDMSDLRALGVEVELLDLKSHFGKQEALKEKLNELGGLYVSGGNSFILRQAMSLSGLDSLVLNMKRDDFIYAGYSAGACVLSPTMRVYAITDDATDFPYPEQKEQIWDGLGILDFIFEPHYDSDHKESASTDKEIKYCIDNKLLFKAYRDGEVLVIE